MRRSSAGVALKNTMITFKMAATMAVVVVFSVNVIGKAQSEEARVGEIA